MPGFEPRGWEALIDQMEVESQEKPVSKGRQGKKKKKKGRQGIWFQTCLLLHTNETCKWNHVSRPRKYRVRAVKRG